MPGSGLPEGGPCHRAVRRGENPRRRTPQPPLVEPRGWAGNTVRAHGWRTDAPGEARRLIAAATHHRLGAWITTSLGLGLRLGETSGLTWDDIDLERALVVVHRSLAWTTDGPTLKATKTKTPRTLALPDQVTDALNGPPAGTARSFTVICVTTSAVNRFSRRPSQTRPEADRQPRPR